MGKKVEKKEIILVVIFVVIILGFLFLRPILKTTGFGILGTMSLFLEASEIFINIYSPTNTTYNFNKGDNYTLDLNVSSSLFTPDSWWYTLTDMRHDTIIYDSIIFTPNTTFDAVRWSNNLTIYSNDTTTGAVFSLGVVFFINVSNSNPIIANISNETFVCENNYISYFFNVTDVDEDVLTSDITPKNPFYLTFSYAFNLTMYTYEIFSGILNKEDAGGVGAGSRTYPETITMADEVSSDSKDINITVIEINNAPSITNIGAQTIWSQGDNSSFDYQVQVLDTEDGDQTSGNFNFSVIFSGQNLFNISSNGVINFTANLSYVGVHNVSVCVEDLGITNLHENISLCGQDGSSITSCNNFSLTVTDENRAPTITGYFPINLSFDADGTDTLNFNISKYDPDGTLPDVYWYVDDVLEEYDPGVSLIDDFSYIFGCGISGIYSIDVVITDGELNDSIQWNVTVSPVACPPGVSPRGVGGGGSIVECVPKWACEEWTQCKNLRTAVGLVNISLEYEFLITGRCSVFNWSNDFCGYQIRECNDLNFCKSNLTKPGLIRECYYTEYPTCEDNLLNCHDGACEVLIDCGGPCKPCETCSDGIKNQNEEEIDCGGSCPMCVDIGLSTFRQMIWFIYLSLIVLIVLLTLIIRSYIKSRKTKRKLEKEVRKRRGS